jgi:threonine/homoserine/homoserine lactone efflux protein
MYPAAKHSLSGMIVVTAVFGTVTIVTMLTITLLALAGVHMTHLNRLERYTHAIAGATILVCGLAIQFLGL